MTSTSGGREASSDCGARWSATTTSACATALAPRTVISPGSPGPPPTSTTLPARPPDTAREARSAIVPSVSPARTASRTPIARCGSPPPWTPMTRSSWRPTAGVHTLDAARSSARAQNVCDALGLRRDGGVDRRVVGRRDDVPGAGEVAVGVAAALPAPASCGSRSPSRAGRDLRAHHGDQGAGLEQPGDAAVGHPAAADHDHAPAVQAQAHRIDDPGLRVDGCRVQRLSSGGGGYSFPAGAAPVHGTAGGPCHRRARSSGRRPGRPATAAQGAGGRAAVAAGARRRRRGRRAASRSPSSWTVLGLPSPALFGGLVAGLVRALAFASPVRVPGAGEYRCAGRRRGRDRRARRPRHPPAGGRRLAAGPPGDGATLALSVVAGLLLRLQRGISPVTGAFSMIAGGAAGITAMARELGADERMVAVLQYLRVLLIVSLMPVAATVVYGAPSGDGVRVPAGGPAGRSGCCSPWCALVGPRRRSARAAAGCARCSARCWSRRRRPSAASGEGAGVPAPRRGRRVPGDRPAGRAQLHPRRACAPSAGRCRWRSRSSWA